jgi:hypothetical protein
MRCFAVMLQPMPHARGPSEREIWLVVEGVRVWRQTRQQDMHACRCDMLACNNMLACRQDSKTCMHAGLGAMRGVPVGLVYLKVFIGVRSLSNGD